MTRRVIRLPMTREQATRRIRELAADTGKVAFTRHARRQMRQRRINRTQVYVCHRKGRLIEGPYQDVRGWWRCTVAQVVAGDPTKVVVAFDERPLLVVITAMGD